MIIADRRHAILDHIILLSEKDIGSYRVTCSMLSTTQKEVTLKQAGSVQQVDHGKSRLQQVIADQDRDTDVIWSQALNILCGDRYNPRWSGAAVIGKERSASTAGEQEKCLPSFRLL